MSLIKNNMASAAEVITSPTVVLNRLPLTPNGVFMSPVPGRRPMLASDRTATLNSRTTPLSAQNDERAEKQDRRRSRILELQKKQLPTPTTSGVTALDKQQAAPLAGFTNDQLAEHYANCIKLSAENKINAKNAFGLHLIDYMSELMKKKEMTNFQMASSSLDASAKIYAGRVDAIHNETFKVLVGLGRSNHDKSGAANSDSESYDGAATEDTEASVGKREEQRKKKKRGGKRSATVVTNLKTININKLDLEYEVEPLFGQMSCGYEDQTSGGLLLTNLQCRDETSQLVLDSNTKMPFGSSLPGWADARRQFHTVNLAQFNGPLRAGLDTAYICEALVDFEFGRWDRDSIMQSFNSTIEQGRDDRHVFNMEADVELPTMVGDPSGMSEGLDGVSDDFMEVDDNDIQETYESKNVLSLTDVKTDGEEEKKGLLQSTLEDIKNGTVGDLMQVLADQPSDYSYFNSKALQMWAGPSHWKLRTGHRVGYSKPLEQEIKREILTRSRVKNDKRSMSLLFDKKLDDILREKRSGTTFTKARLDGYSQTDKTLPPDLHYNTEDGFKLFDKTNCMIKVQETEGETSEERVLDSQYDYDNPNDVNNFCPIQEASGDDAHDDSDGEPSFPLSPDGFTQGDKTSGIFTQPSYDGNNLLEPPRKIARIDIAYAKTAKRMDVRRLKSEMWRILETGQKTNAEPSRDPELGSSPNKSRKLDNPTMPSFTELVHELPKHLPSSMSDNLSPPITFVALLHLANEKGLKLMTNTEMDELKIEKD